jgi:hypothetical protein
MAHLLVDRCLRQDEGGARRNKRKAEADAEQGLVFEAENLKVGEYLDKWLADSVRDTVRQRTYERYESIVRVHIKPPIGWVKLMALTPAHVRALYRKTLDDGLAPRTVNYIHVTLHKALSQAVSDGLVQRNVASVKAPRPEKPEIRPLSPEQARKLIATAHETGDRFEALTCSPFIAGSERASCWGSSGMTWISAGPPQRYRSGARSRRPGPGTNSRSPRTVRAARTVLSEGHRSR